MPTQKLKINPVRLWLRSPVWNHAGEKKPINSKRNTKKERGSGLLMSVTLPRGEQSEGMERGHDTRCHSLVEKLPERGSVVIEAEIGDEDKP